MAIKIRPLSEKDLRETYGEVRSPLGLGGVDVPNTVESAKIFGTSNKVDEVTGMIDNGIYNRRGYITLALPYVNRFLAGDRVSAFSKVYNDLLFNYGVTCLDIAEGKVAYSIKKDVYYHHEQMSKIPYTKDVLIGGELLRHIIKTSDIDAIIDNHLLKFTYSCLPLGIKKDTPLDAVGTITTDESCIWLFDTYYFRPDVLFKCKNSVNQAQAFLDKIEEKRSVLYEGYLNPMLCMTSIKRDVENVLAQIQEYMIVLPLGYRPKIEHQDKLTLAYNKLVKANKDLFDAMHYASMSIADIAAKYRELLAQIRNVTLVKGPYESKQYRPIFELFKGKEGHIRDKMRGGRVDYTGRTVITVDPDMPIDTIGIPLDMGIKLAELNIIQRHNTNASNKSSILSARNQSTRAYYAKKLLNGEYILSGRQPTLYMLGIQAFKIKIVEGNAIVLSPLTCPAFNADFDGDQMYTVLPIGYEAKREAETLLNATNNAFLPRNGECHIAPRQEIIHGLWLATNAKETINTKNYSFEDSFTSYFEVQKAINERTMDIHDTVTIGTTKSMAGYAALVGCLGAEFSKYRFGVLPLTKDSKVAEKPVTEAWFKELIKEIILTRKGKYVSIVTNLVQLGFSVANEYAPNISILNTPNTEHLKKHFEEVTSLREELFNMGFETEESYSTFYSEEYGKLDSAMKKLLKKELASTGYMEMVESGARGSISNLVQMFGMKGRVMKNDTEAFNAIIPHSMSEQLNGLEHFITAYGSRQGLVDKVINTYEPGYLSSQMNHASSYMQIVDYDCGTKEGVLLTYDTILPFISEFELVEGGDRINNQIIRNYLTKLLVGRYIVGVEHEIMNLAQAKDVYDSKVARVDKAGVLTKLAGVKLRSPITCENPCCVKCYGRDLGTNTIAVEGLNIGAIAAQSIGQPGTQLTMKNFQSGGVAGNKNLTSSFTKLNDYLELYDLKKKVKGKEPIEYDFIAPVSGKISTISQGNGTVKLQIMVEDDRGKEVNKLRQDVYLYEGIVLKEYVEIGDSIQKVRGDLNIREILKYRTVEEAQLYYALVLYDLFKKEVDVDLKYFETMVAGSTSYICTKGNETFRAGLSYTIQEYFNSDRSGCLFAKTIRGIKEAVFYRKDIISSILLENGRKGIVRNMLIGGEDSLSSPMVRAAFGLNLGSGSDTPGYLERRGNV